METLAGGRRQGCNPHLKKVLKSYQLSAQRSLQGPGAGTVLVNLTATEPPKSDAERRGAAASTTTMSTASSEPSPAGRAPTPEAPASPPSSSPTSPPSSPGGSGAEAGVGSAPRPFIHSLPLLTAPERGRPERVDTVLEGELIACFVVGGEKRLCLPQVLNSVLRDFTLAQINAVCDDLHIYCSRCNPEQLEELQATGTLPATAASCGLITQTDAERLCAALLPRGQVAPVEKGGGFQVYHECFGGALGVCRPDEPLARSIECCECHMLFGPQQYVSHAHRTAAGAAETNTVHWGFDSANWRAYLLLVEDQAEEGEVLKRRLYSYKHRVEERLKRKQVGSPPVDVESPDCKYEPSDSVEDQIHYLKKSRLDDVAASALPPTVTATSTTYLPYPDPYLYWYDTWALSAFRPWHSLFTATKDGKASPMPFLRDSLPVPPYIGQGPPVLLHPDRVVPLGEYERFDRSYQPNVSLLSIPNPEQAEEKFPPVNVTETEDGEQSRKTNIQKSQSHTVSTITLNPSHRSPSPAPPPSVSPSLPPPPPPSSSLTRTNSSVVITRTQSSLRDCKPEVEMSSDTEDSASESAGVDNSVAAVLESLSSDERDARMAKVLQSLGKRLGDAEAERGRLTAENEVLRRRAREQDAIITQQERVIKRLQEQQERLSSKQHDPEAFQDKVMAMEKELRTLRSEVNRLPNGRHESLIKNEACSSGKDSEQRNPIRRESLESSNAAVSVIHKSESQTLSGTE